jgi:nitroreductase
MELSAEEVLTTTRSLRRRLDFESALDPAEVLSCLRIAQQAPSASGREDYRWLVIAEPDRKAAVAEVYRAAAVPLFTELAEAADDDRGRRLYESALYLAENLERAPLLVLPCMKGRLEGQPPSKAASLFGSILPAVWSFQLALRARGLGSCWTTVHLRREAEMAALLGIPDDHTQVALLPVGRSKGDRFKPARRAPVEEITFLDSWGANA